MHAPKVAVAFAVLILGSSILNPAQAADAAEPPDWARALRLVVDGGPTRSDVDPRIGDIREQLIIEFCSR